MLELYEVIRLSEESAKTEAETRSMAEKSKENEKIVIERINHNHGNDTDQNCTATPTDSTSDHKDNAKQTSTDVNSTKSLRDSFKMKKSFVLSKPSNKRNSDENVSSKVGEAANSNDSTNVISKWVRNVTLNVFHDIPTVKKLERHYISKPKYGNPVYYDPAVLNMDFDDRVRAIKEANYQALT